MDDLEEVIAEFLIESRENLDQVDRDLVALESSPDDLTFVANIFRAIHTIKGTCGFLGYGRLEGISHTGETLLSLLRDGTGRLTPAIATVLLAYVDAARTLLDAIEHTGEEADLELEALKSELLCCIADCERASASTKQDDPRPLQVEHALASTTATPGRKSEPTPVHVVASAVGEPSAPQPADKAPLMAPVALISAGRADGRPEPEVGAKPVAQDATVRVQVQLLDRLMNLVGELVLARNAIVRIGDTAQDPLVVSNIQRLNQVTTELQEGVMATRMQPIENVWAKFPRVVRDLAHQCGKNVRLEMVGKETGLDKTLIEAIKDPMTHLIRNSVDHGIESPEVRAAAGKAAEGKIVLQAFHEGGQVNIEIADDGAGIGLERVLRKAKSKGLIGDEEAARMSPRQVMQLIFLPGFSTAEQVTNVSGRGVGMDVVKTNVERLGGSIDVDSVEGRGTVFRLKIPLTLAIVPALIVNVGAERYAVPQTNLLELVRLDQASLGLIEDVMGTRVYDLRGRLIPLLLLREEFALPARAEDADDTQHILILECEGQQFGLVVDGVCDSEEIVVKSLSKHVRGIGVYAGATIMGDGEVALILDVAGVARRSGILAQRHEPEPVVAGPTSSAALLSDNNLLLVELDGTTQAIPMDAVLRLEELTLAAVEVVGGREVVQYRGGVMPLHFRGKRRADGDHGLLRIVVFEDGLRAQGLVVDRVIDIVHADSALTEVGRRAGVRGTCVIRGRVTEVLDLALTPVENEEKVA